MPTFLQPVELPERCFLDQVLFWVAFQRLPVMEYDDEELAFRLSRENFELDAPSWMLWDDETERAGIPADPRYLSETMAHIHPPIALYDKSLAKDYLSPAIRKKWNSERAAILTFEKEFALWRSHYERAIEYPCSKIFVELKEGRLPALGRKLPALSKKEVLKDLKAKKKSISDIPVTDIPSSFWTLKGIEFESSSAKDSSSSYCHISFLTEDVLKIFPGEREELSGAARIGRTVILTENSSRSHSMIGRRGRPSFHWESFYLEVTDLLRRNEMPAKNEAAIEHFRAWFEQEHGVRPSRAAVGEKLKPYFDKFLKSPGQKI